MRVERIDLADYESALPSSGFEPFHLPAALEVLAEHAAGELVLLGGFKGQQPVGLLPVVVQERSLGTAVLSPPPNLGVPRLGPVVMPTSPKQRKREQVNRTFTDGVLEELDVDGSLTLFRAVCNAAYRDPRPYAWADLDLETAYTYRVDLDGRSPEAVRESFSRSLRREIADAEAAGVTVERAGVDGVRAVHEDARARYEEQGEAFGRPWPYVRDLADALDERCRAYVARSADGDYLGGVVVLYSNDAGYFWVGGGRTTHDGVPVNGLVHWRIIEDLLADPPVDGVAAYDLMGANTERLCRYKAKFGPELLAYYVVESGGAGMEVARTAYRLVSR